MSTNVYTEDFNDDEPLYADREFLATLTHEFLDATIDDDAPIISPWVRQALRSALPVKDTSNLFGYVL